MKTPIQYPHVRRLLREHPWAILPSMLDAIVEVVELRAAGAEPDQAEIEAKIEAARRQPSPVTAPGSVAVVPVFGPIAHRMNVLTQVSNGASAEVLNAGIQQLVRDPNVSAIVLDVDSPGGSVFGIEELADTIHAARGKKPIVAVANALAASAAYWIASQADEFVVTPSGQVGSIGVLAVHDDLSAAAEREGVRRTFVTAGRYKAEGNEFEPLGDEARGHLQGQVDSYYSVFVKHVARGRRVAQKTVRDGFGEGRMVTAQRALELGMVDRIATLQDTVDRLAARSARAVAGKRADACTIDTVAELPEDAPVLEPDNRRAEYRRKLDRAKLAAARRS